VNAPLLASLLARRIGTDPAVLGASSLVSAVEHRMSELGMTRSLDYESLVARDETELEALIESIVVPETWFLRDAEAFAELVRVARSRRGRGEPFRVLSVPCASGEEPLSAAIALLEQGFLPGQFEIDGIDISRRAIERATEASYGPLSFRSMPADIEARFFVDEGGRRRPASEVRRSVRFHVGNAVAPGFVAPRPSYDAIFCRNLLIYLTPAARSDLLDVVLRHLAPGGLVFAGHAEALHMLDARFERCGPAAAFAFRRVESPVATPTAPLPLAPRRRLAMPAASLPATLPAPTPPPMAPPAASPVAAPVQATGSHPGVERARACADRGAFDLAIALLDSTEGGGERADCQRLRATIALARNRHADAEFHLVRALDLAGDDAATLAQLLLLVTRRGERARAEQLRERLAGCTTRVNA
jgi:chemotaxis protein methyltransferase WspC